MKIKHGKLIPLSEKQLLDCAGSPTSWEYSPNNGCKGGTSIAALQYVAEHGIQTEASYPYKATVGLLLKLFFAIKF